MNHHKIAKMNQTLENMRILWYNAGEDWIAGRCAVLSKIKKKLKSGKDFTMEEKKESVILVVREKGKKNKWWRSASNRMDLSRKAYWSNFVRFLNFAVEDYPGHEVGMVKVEKDANGYQDDPSSYRPNVNVEILYQPIG